MSRDRGKYQQEYYAKHKDKWKEYNATAEKRKKQKITSHGRVKTGVPYYKKLTDKQKAFKRSVDHGVDPVEAIKKAYPGITNVSRKLSDVRKNPILATSIDNYALAMTEAGFTDKFEAKKLFTIANKTSEDSSPHADRNTIIVFQDYRKSRGLDIARTETRSLNLNITVTPEMAEFWQRKEGEALSQEREAINGDSQNKKD